MYIHRDHRGAHKIISTRKQPQDIFKFMILWQYWLSIKKSKSTFKGKYMKNTFKNLLHIFNCLFTEIFYWKTDWLKWLCFADKSNSIMVGAKSLISSLLNVALSRHMPFCQLQQCNVCLVILLKITFSCFVSHAFLHYRIVFFLRLVDFRGTSNAILC